MHIIPSYVCFTPKRSMRLLLLRLHGVPPAECVVMLLLQVKVILGEDREATGILLSIDGDDGIVRMELDDQLKILNLRFLGRLEH